jgi:hypothetical protein
MWGAPISISIGVSPLMMKRLYTRVSDPPASLQDGQRSGDP